MSWFRKQTGGEHRGFTLVELTIAVALMVVVVAFFAPILHAVQKSWAIRTGKNEALAQARAFMHHFHRRVSQASGVSAVSDPTATEGYLQLVQGEGGEVRYDVHVAGDIRFGPVGDGADLAGPVGKMCLTCYDGNDCTTPVTDCNAIRLVHVEATFLNTTAGPDLTISTSAYIRAGAVRDDEEPEDDEGGFQPGVAMKQRVEWGGSGALIDSYRCSQGPYDPDVHGAGAIVSVNTTGCDKIAMWNGSVIYGDACIGPGGDPDEGIATWGGSSITGTRAMLENEVAIPSFSAPAGPPFEGSHEGTLELKGSTTETINSDRYFNKILLWDTSKLVIEGDVTLLLNNKLELGDNAGIEIQPDSSLRLYVSHNVSVWNHAKLNTSTKNPSRLRLYMTGNNRIFSAAGQAGIYAVLQNPLGEISLSDDAEFFGKIKGESLTGGGRIHIDLDADFD